MKLVTICSPEFSPVAQEFFFKSWFRFPQGFNRLTTHQPPNPIGAWASRSWRSHYVWRQRMLVDELRLLPPGDQLVFCGCDTQWFEPIGVYVAGFHPEAMIVSQMDVGMICADFMRLTNTPEVLQLLQRVEQVVSVDGVDQELINRFAPDHGVSIAGLPLDEFWTTRKLWKMGDPVPEVPATIKFHHGNWNYRIEDKLAILSAVREEYFRAHR